MKNKNGENAANYECGGGKLRLRELWEEYKSEFVFGVSLMVCVGLSYWLAQRISLSFYVDALSPILNGCIVVVSLFGAWLMFRHYEGVRVRLLWGSVLLTWAVLMSLLLARVFSFYAPMGSDETLSLRGFELLVGNFYAWLLLHYPTVVLRPGYLNFKKALVWLLPAILIALVDYFLPIDLSWLLAIYPVVLGGCLIAFHLRGYRQWCEENYSSLEDVDAQWIVRYMIMYFISGACYTVMSFSYTSAHAFTQQWMLLLMLGYSTEHILFRPDPLDIVHYAKKKKQAMLEVEEEASDPPLSNAAYREMLDKWMDEEKPYLHPDFRLIDLRQVLPLNRTYISQLINAEYGCNFFQWVTKYRIEEAKRLMTEHPDMKMQDVAEQSGFSSPVVFSRTFAREEGKTPREWNIKVDNS